MLGDEQVLERAHAGEEPCVLEGPHHARIGDDAMAGQRVDAPVPPIGVPDEDLAGGRLVESGDAVEGGRLAGAVGPDHRSHATRLGDEVEVGHRGQAAEAHGEAARDQRHARVLAHAEEADGSVARGGVRGGVRAGARTDGVRPDVKPPGRSTMTSTMRAPNTSMRYCAKSRPSSGAPTSTAAAAAMPKRPPPPSTTTGEHERALGEGEALRRDEALVRGEEAAGETAQRRAGGEGAELDERGIEPHGGAGDLVLAQRLPGAADRQPAQARREGQRRQRHRQDHEVQPCDAVQAARTGCRRGGRRWCRRPSRQARTARRRRMAGGSA